MLRSRFPYPALVYGCLFLFLPIPSLLSQTNSPIITGQVIDHQGTPLPGATILIKGTARGTATDLDGRYSLEVQPEDILLFSYAGFTPVERSVGSQTELDITLTPNIQELEQVVVIGYGIQKKKDVTGTTSSIREEDFNPGIINAPEELIRGKIAGVELISNNGAPGSGFTVRIRGASTIRAGNEPLYVIDGYPLDIATTTPGNPSAVTPLRQGEAGKNPLAFLNPEDIASIHILKDASAGAIYGARAANGVVLIETKSGRAGQTRLRYHTYANMASLSNRLDVLSADEWRAAQSANGFSGNDFGANTDWQDESFRTAFTHHHNLSLDGGSDRSTYRASFGYLDQEGIAEGNTWTRWNGQVKLRHQALRDRLTLQGNVNLSRVNDQPSFGGGAATNPTYPIFNEDGSLFFPSPTSPTIVAEQRLSSDLITTNRLLANLNAAFFIFDDLTYKINFGADNAIATRRSNRAIQLAVQENGQATLSEREIGSLLIEHYLTYSGSWSDHQLTTLGGYSYQKFTTKDFLLSRAGFSSDEILNVNNIAAGGQLLINESGVEQNALQSFFARINYQLKDRYLFTANFRADGSTRFGANNRYGLFPSLAIAWRLSEEDYFQQFAFIDQLKLRASWGLTGNQEIPNKITQFVVGTPPFSSYVLDGSSATAGYTFVRTPNDQLQWEETRQINAGLDISLWRGRLTGSIDYFDKRTSELLVQITAASTPTSTIWTNLDADVLNRGLEVALAAVLWQKDRFQWESSVVFTTIKNEVRGLPTDLFPSENQIITNGAPLGTFWGRQWVGFDEQGFDDFLKNPDGTDAFTAIGHALPDFTWGWTNQFRFRHLDLSFLLQGVAGNEVNGGSIISKIGFPFGGNLPREVLDTPESFSNVVRFSSRFLESGSYVRLNYLTLGYQFPLKTNDWLESLRLYLTGTNLLLWTPYTGYDPEVNIVSTTADRFGRPSGIPTIGNAGGYPRARTFQLGLQVTFL